MENALIYSNVGSEETFPFVLSLTWDKSEDSYSVLLMQFHYSQVILQEYVFILLIN